ncbi:TPA: DNA adenine methylase, partial [Streptococcus suis]
MYGFNNQIRFNSKGEFNMPTGKRDFNQKMLIKLEKFMKALKQREITFTSLDFREFLNQQHFNECDFIYLDPPYLISTATYNENGGWSETDEKDLLSYLDQLNAKG